VTARLVSACGPSLSRMRSAAANICSRAARALRPGGRLAVFWNAFQTPPDLAEAFATVYRRVMPDSPLLRGGAGTSGPDAYRGLCAKAADGMRQASAFGEPEQWRFD